MSAGGPDGSCEESIKVCCRFRPQNPLEKSHLHGKIAFEVPDQGSVYVPSSEHTFNFDRVFRWDASQKEVYEYAAKPTIHAVLRGFNGTVFAYGQTSSGKTYTMEGPDIEDKVYQGVIPRMVWSIFDGIYHADEHIEFLVKVSIVEIYNERIRDLLDPQKDNMKIHEDKVRGVFIGEVTESYVGSEQEIFDAMRAGHYNRSMAVTNMNEHSSRSHLVFMLTIEQKNLHDRSVKVGKLYLVDLAGSEKVAKTGASGERLDEAKNINRSLSALGNVINALTDKKYTHVPYRDSKLTRVLQESLGGNSKTSLIITCSPSAFNEQETVSTLRFGQRAKMIKNVARVNHEWSTEELKLILEKKEAAIAESHSMVLQLEKLCRQNGIQIPDDLPSVAVNAVTVGGGSSGTSGYSVTELMEQLQDKMAALKESTERITDLNRERDEIRRQLCGMEDEKQQLLGRIVDITAEREKSEYERNEVVDSLEKFQHDNRMLSDEIEALNTNNQRLIQAAAERNEQDENPDQLGALLDRVKDSDRPLKKKVSQLDKNLEQLTVMYHKLVSQNSGLKVEVNENDKKIQRKDARIAQLERNLREAKQKYEKLLTQCANLTAAMDIINSQTSSFSNTVPGTGVSTAPQVRRLNIVRPVRGGLAPKVDEQDQVAPSRSHGDEHRQLRSSLRPST
eukprot:gnl/TRDRNA2_/TRDRNA2_172530_c0_seq2.p1 gnl/TRDRNA2_/TRDRNA2_172530_c0~~gnl/TRDRNA2_/TRDRNA2_172530_c0_seq2.p1  ORF type:complete len:677 (-),score=177.21 gnl/TRDRNA2_/TRDRNA2_172530_c0_seq2:306-2336(-)